MLIKKIYLCFKSKFFPQKFLPVRHIRCWVGEPMSGEDAIGESVKNDLSELIADFNAAPRGACFYMRRGCSFESKSLR